MTQFSDRFGGSQIQPSDVAYREFSANVNQVLKWPPYSTLDDVVAKVMNFNPLVSGVVLFMPDAREASPGETIVFYNNSAFAYTVVTYTGISIATVAAGTRRIILLTDNTTQDGSWITTILGVGTGSLDIASAAGAGLRAVGTRLNVAFPVITVNSSREITENDRDKVLVWTGGSGTFTLPTASAMVDFNIEVRNQGTGILTLQPTGGQLIDGVSNLLLNVQDSLWLHSASTLSFWTTIGRGKATQFAFTQLQKTVTGGEVILTLTEAANVVQEYNGALVANCDIILPAVVQVYYVSNQTSGPFTLRFRNAGSGTSVIVPQGQNGILSSDGINVINAATTAASSGGGSGVFGPGSAPLPSVSINGVNNGFFSPGSGSVSFSSSGVEIVAMTSDGLKVVKVANPVLGVKATGSNAVLSVERPAGAEGSLTFSSGAILRWLLGVTGGTESGGNIGSDFKISRYNDAGALIDSPFAINRATGIATLSGVRDLSLVGELKTFIGPPRVLPGFLFLDGSLVSRITYADLWVYAQGAGLATEAEWAAGQNGRFSVGNGSTTFRIPDLRGVFLRGLDQGRGLDPAREWGRYQDQNMMAHGHAVTDPGHTHAASSPAHTHGLNDPGHSHPVNDPTHTHQYSQAISSGNQKPAASGTAPFDTTTVVNTNNSATGITIANQGAGITIGSANAVINIGNNSTGVTVAAAGSGEEHPRNMAYPVYVRY